MPALLCIICGVPQIYVRTHWSCWPSARTSSPTHVKIGHPHVVTNGHNHHFAAALCHLKDTGGGWKFVPCIASPLWSAARPNVICLTYHIHIDFPHISKDRRTGSGIKIRGLIRRYGSVGGNESLKPPLHA